MVVYALEEEKIIGSSRMVNSEDYSAKGLVRDLDVIITQEDKRTEYEPDRVHSMHHKRYWKWQ